MADPPRLLSEHLYQQRDTILAVLQRVAKELPDRLARFGTALLLAALAFWIVTYALRGPSLAINHDELNYLYGSMRLLTEGRPVGYAHGPVTYELIALAHVVAYAVTRGLGTVHSAPDYLTFVIRHEARYLEFLRALAGLFGLATIAMLYRLARIFVAPVVAFGAVVLSVAGPTFLTLASVLKEDVLYWFLLVFSLYAAWRAVAVGHTRWALAAGCAIGSATATKYLGVFAFLLVALPFLQLAGITTDRRRHLSLVMGCSGIVTLGLVFPFLLTDTASVVQNVRQMDASSAAAGSGQGLVLTDYLTTHIPDLVGWPATAVGFLGLALALRRNPAGSILLAVVPLAQLLFLGLRHGQAQAYYIFPAACLLALLACATVYEGCRRFWPSGAGILVFVSCLANLADQAHIPGAAKQALVLLAPDTRLVVRDFVLRRVPPGSRVVIGAGIIGLNFWGPPLLPALPDGERGVFARARESAFSGASEARFRVRLVDGRASRLLLGGEDCWVILPRLGSVAGRRLMDAEPPRGCERVARFYSFPEPQSQAWPMMMAGDYDALREATFHDVWARAAHGLSMDVLLCRRGVDAVIDPRP